MTVAEGLSGSNSRITKIRADGKVLITTEKQQTATSDWGDLRRQVPAGHHWRECCVIPG